MAVTKEYNELVLRPPPGARWHVDLQGQAILQVRRGAEEMAIEYLARWLDSYTRPMAAYTAAVPAAPAPGAVIATDEHVTSKSTPVALRAAAAAEPSPPPAATPPSAVGLEPCDVTHTNEIRRVRCSLAKGHGGQHCVGVDGKWYPLEIAPKPRELPEIDPASADA